ncbi:MAG: hypothetical protein ACR2P3_00235, partial [Geminicoccaceae bacterium]
MAEAPSGATETAEAGDTAAVVGTEAAETTKAEAPVTNGQAKGEDAGEAAGTDAASDDVQTSWRELLSDEFTKEAERFTSIDQVFKRNRELRKLQQTAIQPLGAKPTDEQLAAYRKRLEIPEAPDGYGVDPPEWFDDRGKENLGDFLGKAHGLNLTPTQVKGVFEAYAGYMQAGAEAEIAAVNSHTEAGVKALKEEWGLDFDANLAVAKRALSHFGGEEIATTLNELKLEGGGVAASHPAIVKLLAEVGRAASEPTGVHVPLVTSSE